MSGIYNPGGAGGSAYDRFSTRVNSEVSVTTTTPLDSTAFGKVHACTGSSAYTVTLPAPSGNGGKFVSFRVATTSYAIVTISPNASETIGGESGSAKYVTGEWVTLYCDGTNWSIVEEQLLPVVFKRGRSTDQTGLSAGAWNVVQFNDPSPGWDSHSWWDGTNYRYVPKAPGKYAVATVANVLSLNVGKFLYVAAVKNGSEVSPLYGMCRIHNSGTVDQSSYLPVTTVFDMNGTTDYIDTRVWYDTATGNSLSGGSNGTFINVWRVRR